MISLIVTTGVGAVMIRLGLARGLLESRNADRRCPSCGRLIDGRRLRSMRREPTMMFGTPMSANCSPAQLASRYAPGCGWAGCDTAGRSRR